MHDDSTSTAQSLFHQALELPPHKRDAFLDAECGSNADLREELGALLSHDAVAPSGFLEGGPARQSAGGTDTTPVAPHWLAPGLLEAGGAFGRYRIQKLIGHGGMGSVYEAEQDNPRRTVALKVLRFGHQSPSMVKRFQREAHLLARLQHPSIAHIYEAGIVESEIGPQPFFAMEFIDGRRLDEWSGNDANSVEARLWMMARICDAVHHAHMRGIIHRDLKPANILVVAPEDATTGEGADARWHEGTTGEDGPERPNDAAAKRQSDRAAREEDVRRRGEATGKETADAVPKILDFGIARATEADFHLVTLQTAAGQLIGTVPYMSPEQIGGRMDDVDDRSDVYSLGVILYEMLAGRLPLDVRARPIPEAARIICEEEPSRLGSVDAALRGDIDTIVAKALDKDPDRRYPSAAAMAADIRRYLRQEPIVARPASTLYQLQKFAKRNKKLVSVIALSFVLLSAATVVAVRFGLAEKLHRELADREAHRARLLAAQSALNDGDVVFARRILEGSPAAYRDTWEWRHLSSRLDTCDYILTGHTDTISTLNFTPDGKTLVSTSLDGTVRLWDVASHAVRSVVWTEHEPVINASLSSDASAIALVAAEGVLRVIDLSSGTQRWSTERDPENPARGVAWSPDGKRLAATMRGATVQLRNASTGEVLAVTERRKLQGPVLAYHPDGQRLFVADYQCLWTRDALTGSVLSRHVGNLDGQVLATALSGSASLVATGSFDKTISVCDSTTLEPLWRLRAHTGAVRALAFDPAGTMLASGSTDCTVRLWDTTTGEVRATLLGHEGLVESVAYSPDGRSLASGGEDATIRLWNVAALAESSRVLRGHTRYVYDVAADPTDPAGRIASAAWDRTVRLWDAVSGDTQAVIDFGSVPRFSSVAFSPDGRLLACAGGAPVLVFDTATATLVAELPAPKFGAASMVFSSDSTQLLVARKLSVTMWNLASQAEMARYDFGEPVGAAAAPNGTVVGVFERGAMRLLDAETGRTIVAFQGHDQGVTALTVAPDGRRFATASEDGTARVWDMKTGACLAVLPGYASIVWSVVFSPDGSRIATGADDQSIRLWDAQTYEELLELHGHENYVHALAFSQDGTMLVSASGDGTVRVWDTVPRFERVQQAAAARARMDVLRPAVRTLLADLRDPGAVADHLREDAAFTNADRRAALRVLLELCHSLPE